MILLNGSINAPSLHFPSEYALALPNCVLEGKKAPLALLLHDLGKGREQWIHSVRLEALVEEYQIALLMPEGRRSCFLNMPMGPCWSRFLKDDLIPGVQGQLCLSDAPVSLIGLGSGALGTLQLAADTGFFCAAIEPDYTSPFSWQKDLWPKEREWAAVFEGQTQQWAKERFAALHGIIAGEAEAVNGFASAFGLEGWNTLPVPGADLEQKLRLVLRACAAGTP